MSRKDRAKPRGAVPSPRRSALGLSPHGLRSNVLCEIADDRVREATILLGSGQFTGAAYLAGYAVELLLKAVLSSRRHGGIRLVDSSEVSFEYKTHNLEDLLKFCGLKDQMRSAAARNFELGSNWAPLRR